MKKRFVPLKNYVKLETDKMLSLSTEFYSSINKRRSVRDFSEEPPPIEIIENCIKSAGTAPSGANMQPWTFVLVKDKEVKRKIRVAAENEEKEFYTNRAPEEWIEALSPLGTNQSKPFLETAPFLIVIFEKKYSINNQNKKIKHYYTKESVGIAAGILITALHNCGLVSLTHTPSPMNFLNKLLTRPDSEKPYLILVVGYPAKNVIVPNIQRKPLKDIMVIL